MPSVRHEQASLYYERSGAGPAVAFAHGAGGNTLSWWQQVPHFGRSHTVITFDHRGFGRSACAPEHFHPRYFAGDLLAILDDAGVERAAVVCQSMGGWTGLGAALSRPDRVSCLVLAGTPGGLLTPEVQAAAARAGAAAARDGIRGNAALAPDFPARHPDLAHLYDQISGLNAAFEPRLLARLFDADARVAPAALRGWRTPTLFLAGECDQLFPPRALREAAALLPGAELKELPGVGHSTYFEAPDRFNAIVGAFLAAHG
jgi:pimeloyl-ACP methyl ester carboxylesterase